MRASTVESSTYIQHAAATGLYEIRGLGAKRQVPHFDDLVFLAGSASRYPLEGYREKCDDQDRSRHALRQKPIELAIPITFAGMSFGSLSARVKEALGRAATELGTSTTTGDGGMTREERQSSRTLVYQCLPSRYGFNPTTCAEADAIEVVIGQGAKPGGGGMLLGQKVSPRVAGMRTLPAGIDQRSACRHPDWTGPDDLVIKINELREITGLEGADLREDRRDADLQRREAGRALRGRRGRGRRHAGAAPRPRRRCSSSTWASRRWRRCARRWTRSRT